MCIRDRQWPDSLRYKVDAFRTRAIVPEYESGLFQQQSWLSVFIGQNIEPASYDPRADWISEDDLGTELSRMHKAIADRVAATSLHLDFVRDYGAAVDREWAT